MKIHRIHKYQWPANVDLKAQLNIDLLSNNTTFSLTAEYNIFIFTIFKYLPVHSTGICLSEYNLSIFVNEKDNI